jgi:hypothetical protein
VTPGLGETDADADADADADVDVEVDADECAEAETDTEPETDALPRCVTDAVGEVLPGDREVVAVDAPDDDEFVCGVGVKVGVAPPPEQAETATATRTAPAAERPTISHAPWVAPGLVRRIFTNPLLECVSD